MEVLSNLIETLYGKQINVLIFSPNYLLNHNQERIAPAVKHKVIT